MNQAFIENLEKLIETENYITSGAVWKLLQIIRQQEIVINEALKVIHSEFCSNTCSRVHSGLIEKLG